MDKVIVGVCRKSSVRARMTEEERFLRPHIYYYYWGHRRVRGKAW